MKKLLFILLFTIPFVGFGQLDRDYYENGQIKNEVNYKDGKKEGLWKEYYENGQLKVVEKKDRTPINRNTTRFIRYPNEKPFEDILKRQETKKINENPRTRLPFLIKKKP